MTAQQPQHRAYMWTGMGAGFSLTVPASTTSRTLKVYVGAKWAQGKFTASLNARPMSMRLEVPTYDSNVLSEVVYTLVFNSSVA